MTAVNPDWRVVHPQRAAALAHATAIRAERKALLGAVGEARTLTTDRAADLLEALPSVLETMPTFDFLVRIRRWGPAKARKCLWRRKVTETRQLGYLTERQRLDLADHLRANP